MSSKTAAAAAVKNGKNTQREKEVPASENPIVVAFRNQVLKRGASGIKGIGIFFRNIDDDKSRLVSLQEFQEGILNHNINMNRNDVQQLFSVFDRNNDGQISFDEFLLAVRV
jgi:hypothetical protein